MSKLTHAEIKSVLDQIIDAITELDSFFNENPIKPQVAPPASNEELIALELHWGHPLPPSYRYALSVYNGISNFWADVPLLSTREIIEDRNDTSTFEEPFPDLWKFIFACGTESYDALCFDASEVEDDGEMPVVELSDEGEGRRWPRFDVFLKSLLEKLKEEIQQEKADRERLSD